MSDKVQAALKRLQELGQEVKQGGRIKLGSRVRYSAVLVRHRGMATRNHDRVLASAWLREPRKGEGIIVGRRTLYGGYSEEVEFDAYDLPIRAFRRTDTFPAYLIVEDWDRKPFPVPRDAVEKLAGVWT